MRTSAAAIVLLLAAAVAAPLAGCSALGGSPATTHTATTSTTRPQLAQAQETHEYPSPARAPETATGVAASPLTAIRSFALSYINWQADTVTAQMRALAAQSVAQARSEMELAAADTAGDYELRRGGVANSGTVEAIAPRTGHRYEYVVVTLERTTATATSAYQGLRPAWHLALATVARLRTGRWAVSAWQPES